MSRRVIGAIVRFRLESWARGARMNRATAACSMRGKGAVGAHDEPIAVEQPQKAGPIDPGERLVTVAAEQVARPPAERRSMGGPAVEEEPHIIDETLPAAQRHVSGRAIGVEAREALGPCA